MNALKSSRKTRIFAGIALASATALVLAGCSTPSGDDGGDGGEKPAANVTLKMGSLLPATGALAFLGAPMEAGVQLAVQEVNDADAGVQIELSTADEGDLDNKAYETSMAKLQSEGITTLVGAASSSVTKLIVDGNTSAGILAISPSNTGVDFAGLSDLYFRTAPSDYLQGEVLANTIAEDGHKSLGIIYQNDPYGQGLAGAIKEVFEGTGGTVVAEASYNQGDGQFNAQVSEVMAAKPDSVAIVSYDQFATIAPLLQNAGADAGAMYLVDGNLKDWPDLPVDLTGSKGTRAGAELPDDFVADLNEVWTGLGHEEIDALTYSAEAYDAVILMALGALQANSDKGADIAGELIEVSGGSGDGEKCDSYEDCAALINDGKKIDYDGYSGEVTFDEDHDPQGAAMGVYEFESGNVLKRIS
ncbi:amino acid ABC transporter substrate-binding protein [Microbacterium bovistercoris]|uniref:Amino acid ABC transporter substrate-binding protein n=1 Tax=Microbacterium bovistercoris TaxID=2293570 RepID=A0A371NSZ8_9MICO|nr:penicillin-binding protein activator [Microbacterium bovistercoris]REJ05311.1 amino acid ABC transporter substrate-binding protein [Microbacterium bovistercoris]